jgi:hypothetical protein
MKSFATALFLSLLSLSFAQQDDVEILKNEIKTAKDELKNNLGNLKYDGSKTTYYEVKGSNDFKDLEIILFLRDNYSLNFSGKASRGKVRLRIYDKPSENGDRLMLFEVKNISGKNASVTARELNEMLAFYDPNPQPLRSVYVEYEISKGKSVRGAVVLVLGY